MSKINYWEATENAVKFQENGLLGMKTPEGEVILPAEYDQIYQYNKSDIFYVEKDGASHYINSKKEHILLKFGSIFKEKPFWHRWRENDNYVITKQIVAESYGSDTAKVNGDWVHFNIMQKSDVRRIFGDCEVIPITKDIFDLIESHFLDECYGGWAFSKGKNALAECCGQIKELVNSCNPLTKVWISNNSIFTLDDLKICFSRYNDEDWFYYSSCLDSFVNIGVGYDNSLKPDEVRMLQIDYEQRDFDEDDDLLWFEFCIDFSLNSLKDKRSQLEKHLVKLREKYGPVCEKLARKYYFGVVPGVSTDISYSLQEEISKVDYLIEQGASIELSLDYLCENMVIEGLDYNPKHDKFITNANLSCINRMIKYLIKLGSDINHISWNRTPLDYIRWFIDLAKKHNQRESKIQLLRKIEKTLLDNGAKSVSEMDEDYVFWKQRKGYLYQDGKFVEK